jgi:hypothetical protein
MSTAQDLHREWLERQLAAAEDRQDALLFGTDPVDLSAGDDWEAAEARALGKPEERLRRTWNDLGSTPPGREATSVVEMRAAVSDAQRGEIARLQREVTLAQTSDDELVAEWFERTGVRR